MLRCYLRDSTKASDVKPTWVRVREHDCGYQGRLSARCRRAEFNDRFGDVFGNIYAFTGDGLSQRQLRDYVEDIRAKVLTIPMSARWTFWARRMKRFTSNSRPARSWRLASTPARSSRPCKSKTPWRIWCVSGRPGARLASTTGEFTSEASLRAINLRVNDQIFINTVRADCTITHGCADAPERRCFAFVALRHRACDGDEIRANLLKFEAGGSRTKMAKITAGLPWAWGPPGRGSAGRCRARGVGLHGSAFRSGWSLFLRNSVSSAFGLRAGLVVAMAVPLVLAITFVVMSCDGIRCSVFRSAH